METARRRILIVQDDPDVCEVISTALVHIGHHEVVSSCYNELEEKLKNDPPDIILLDTGVYQHKTKDLCRMLKRRKTTRNLPLLIFSTHPDVERFSREAGADDFLPKPFDLHALLDKVNRLGAHDMLK